MIHVAGYQVLEELYESAHSVAYRARREQDGQSVILKILRHEFPDPLQLKKYRQEFDILSSLNQIPGVIQAFGLEQSGNRLLMIVEDFGGDSLQKLLSRKRLGLQETLEIGARLSVILQGVHETGLVHRDINPGNIIYNPATREMKLIDFGISASLGQDGTLPADAAGVEGTFDYIAPEQTGRTARQVDQRADLYSLGVTLYELLTGVKPFETHDPEQAINCHLSKRPTPPGERDPAIPGVVSSLVMKLLAKDPQERYQTAQGLRADLDRCLLLWQSSARIDAFVLGEKDVVSRLILPREHYGREPELKELLEWASGLAAGQRELVLLCGQTGIGKTSFVQDLFRPFAIETGLFLGAAFESLKEGTPYSAFVEIFRALARSLLAESDTVLGACKKELHEALHPNARVILDLVPEMEWILGAQPKLVELPPQETQNRFHRVLESFMAVFCRPDRPLIVFLDNAQWADSASLKLMQRLLEAEAIQGLLLIAAYRSDELEPAHPLIQLAFELERKRRPVRRMSLSPLSEASIRLLIWDTLHCEMEDASRLAALLLEKTGGNPFFIKEFLISLASEQTLLRDVNTGKWLLDFKRVQAHTVTENVADLLIGRVQKLSAETQELLQIAACVGRRFELELIAATAGVGVSRTVEFLAGAVGAGILSLVENEKFSYAFVHDRLQQAIYEMNAPPQKRLIHRSIGMALKDKVGQSESLLFEVANHLNIARAELDTDRQRIELARINLAAGQRAKQAVAYDQAQKYLLTGRSLLGEKGWDLDYDLMLSLSDEAIETAYLTAELAQVERLSQDVELRARTLLDRVKAYHTLILCQISRNDQKAAVKTALGFLSRMGLNFVEHPGELRLVLGVLRTRLKLNRRQIDSLLDLPEMTDPHKLAAIRIMRSIGAALYLTNPRLMALLLFEQVRLMLAHGNSSWSGSAYAAFGILLCGQLGDLDGGYRLGLQALRLNEKYQATDRQCRTLYIFNALEKHWKEPLGNTLGSLLEAHRLGLESGDFEFAALALQNHSQHSFFHGRELAALEKEMLGHRAAIERMQQNTSLRYLDVFRQTVLNLMGRSADPCVLTGAAMDEHVLIPHLTTDRDRTGLIAVYVCKVILEVIFQRHLQAVHHASLAEELLGSGRGLFGVARFWIYRALACLQAMKGASPKGRREYKRTISFALKKARTWARHCPANHDHLLALLEAECHRLERRYDKAQQSYERAIAAAKKNEFLHEEALCNEFVGAFYQSRGMSNMAVVFIKQARYTYLKWGALAKVREMDEHPGVLIGKP